MSKFKSIDLSAVLDISDWPDLDEALAGSRAKRTVADPNTDCLYVFKEPKERREAQIWSEILASYIAGDLLEWPVQHVQLAVRHGRIGNLLKYIYRPDSDAFVPGEQLCKHVDPDFDPRVGTRHTWALIRRIHDKFVGFDQHGKHLVRASASYNLFWVRAVAFDALISNTDRHAENWALRLGESEGFMAPLFDNASSCGCEIDETSLSRKWFHRDGNIIDAKVKQYLARGEHHLRKDEERFKFEDLAAQVLAEFPEFRSQYQAIADMDLNMVDKALEQMRDMEGVPVETQLSSKRSKLMLYLLKEGQERINRCIASVT